MRAQTVDVKSSTGRILCCTVFRPGGKKLLAKGHVISDEDVRILESEGMETIWVTELEDGEIGEDDAVCAVATEMGCGSFEIRLAAGGRANLVATENCCVLVDDELLKQINCTASVVIATSLNYGYAVSGQRISTGRDLLLDDGARIFRNATVTEARQFGKHGRLAAAGTTGDDVEGRNLHNVPA